MKHGGRLQTTYNAWSFPAVSSRCHQTELPAISLLPPSPSAASKASRAPAAGAPRSSKSRGEGETRAAGMDCCCRCGRSGGCVAAPSGSSAQTLSPDQLVGSPRGAQASKSSQHILDGFIHPVLLREWIYCVLLGGRRKLIEVDNPPVHSQPKCGAEARPPS